MGLKRKAEEEEKVRAGKIRKGDSYGRREEKRDRSISKSVRAVSSDVSESESDKEVELESFGEGSAALNKIGPSVVERDVSASSEVRMEAVITGEKLVLDNRRSYVECGYLLRYSAYIRLLSDVGGAAVVFLGADFVDISDANRSTLEWAGAEIPAVNLEYPGINATERCVHNTEVQIIVTELTLSFPRILLLLPKDAGEEYNPIEDVISVRSVPFQVPLPTFL